MQILQLCQVSSNQKSVEYNLRLLGCCHQTEERCECRDRNPFASMKHRAEHAFHGLTESCNQRRHGPEMRSNDTQGQVKEVGIRLITAFARRHKREDECDCETSCRRHAQSVEYVFCCRQICDRYRLEWSNRAFSSADKQLTTHYSHRPRVSVHRNCR